MRIPDQLIKCVGFVSCDKDPLQFGGTAFVVGVKVGSDKRGYLHLVTAKHVADAIEPGEFVIAMNGKDGSPLFLKSGEVRWWYHPTEPESVDVAVIPFATERLVPQLKFWGSGNPPSSVQDGAGVSFTKSHSVPEAYCDNGNPRSGSFGSGSV